MSDDLFTAQEAADFLKVKKTTVYELVKRGDLPSTKIGKQLRIPRAALEGMTGAAHSQPSAKPPLREGGRAGVILCGQDSSLDLIAKDRPGLAMDVTTVMATAKMNILGMTVNVLPDGYTKMNLVVEVRTQSEVTTIMNKLNQVQGVYQVSRVSG